MFYGIRDRLKRGKYDFQVREILHTSPARITTGSPAVILTQLQKKDLRMFLIASKAFMAKVPVGHVYILNDGTLTAVDEELLVKHMQSVTFLRLDDYRSPVCPQGACWERLLSIAELVKEHYVIQLDSDTLAIGNIDEVCANVERGIAFTLGTWDDQKIESMHKQCEMAKIKISGANPHVQQVAEANFEKIKKYNSLLYVKGCAGFAGFPKGSFTSDFVEEISAEMEAAIGCKWHEWGSEQVMSNIVVSNIPGAVVLPHPKYSSCENLDNFLPAFIHFIGYCRFNKGAYARLSQQVIKGLRNAQ
ncbi:MAG TPA: hypothetical protein DHV59_11095 [Oxalobacteraceae bacterium]|nr:hypothetical protein [Oxalobacteraceae bacterium]